jgi:hypothetical protein
LSRACLGKMFVCRYKWLRKTVFTHQWVVLGQRPRLHSRFGIHVRSGLRREEGGEGREFSYRCEEDEELGWQPVDQLVVALGPGDVLGMPKEGQTVRACGRSARQPARCAVAAAGVARTRSDVMPWIRPYAAITLRRLVAGVPAVGSERCDEPGGGGRWCRSQSTRPP